MWAEGQDLCYVKGKVKQSCLCTCHKAYREIGSMAAVILNFGTRWR